jgi:hypothetical protein
MSKAPPPKWQHYHKYFQIKKVKWLEYIEQQQLFEDKIPEQYANKEEHIVTAVIFAKFIFNNASRYPEIIKFCNGAIAKERIEWAKVANKLKVIIYSASESQDNIDIDAFVPTSISQETERLMPRIFINEHNNLLRLTCGLQHVYNDVCYILYMLITYLGR